MSFSRLYCLRVFSVFFAMVYLTCSSMSCKIMLILLYFERFSERNYKALPGEVISDSV